MRTGLRVGTDGWWVHVCSTDRLTHYAAHPSRGRVALDAIGIAPKFGGTSVHDGLRSYQGYSFTQALCNVHHLRELTFLEEELKQDWACKMKDLLVEMKTEVEHAKALDQHHLDEQGHHPDSCVEKRKRQASRRPWNSSLSKHKKLCMFA